jgi:hypothetical protein
MPMATKEFVLNHAMNRWQLNFKKNVGPTSESIRNCNPHNYQEWEDYYFSNIRSREHLTSLGKKLFQKIRDEVSIEKRFHPDLLSQITEQDCINYIFEVVLKRTYDGFIRERS